MTKTPLTRVGDAACPAGMLRGFDGDSCRSILLSDGRVFNIFNGYSYPIPGDCRSIFSQPQGIRDLVAALISTSIYQQPQGSTSTSLISTETEDADPLRLVHVSNQLDGRDACEVGAGLAANGFCDFSVLDNTRIVLHGAGVLETCVITYNNGEVGDALANPAPGSDDNGFIARASDLNAPSVLLAAAPKLIGAGFRVTGANFDETSRRTLIFLKGDKFRNIKVELTWFV